MSQNHFDTDLIKVYDPASDTHGFIKKYDSPLKFHISFLKEFFTSKDLDVKTFHNASHIMSGFRTVIAHDTLTNTVLVMCWNIEQTATEFFKILTKLKPDGIPKVDWLSEYNKNVNYNPVRWVIWSGVMQNESKILSVQMDTAKFLETNKYKETWCMFTENAISISYGDIAELKPYPIGNAEV